MLLNIIVGIIMLVALVGMIFLKKQIDSNPKAKPAIIGMFAVIIICTLIMVFHSPDNTTDGGKHYSQTLQFKKASGVIMGQTLAKKMPAAKVLIVLSPTFGGNGNDQKAIVEGLKEGFGDAITDVKVETPEKLKNASKNSYDTPISFLLPVQDFNKFIEKHKDRTLIISTFGFPYPPRDIKLMTQFNDNPKSAAKIAIIDYSINNMEALFELGILVAAVQNKMESDIRTKPAVDLQKRFNQRYVLITKDSMKNK